MTSRPLPAAADFATFSLNRGRRQTATIAAIASGVIGYPTFVSGLVGAGSHGVPVAALIVIIVLGAALVAVSLHATRTAIRERRPDLLHVEAAGIRRECGNGFAFAVAWSELRCVEVVATGLNRRATSPPGGTALYPTGAFTALRFQPVNPDAFARAHPVLRTANVKYGARLVHGPFGSWFPMFGEQRTQLFQAMTLAGGNRVRGVLEESYRRA